MGRPEARELPAVSWMVAAGTAWQALRGEGAGGRLLVVSTADRQVNTEGRSGTLRCVDSVLSSIPAHLCLPSTPPACLSGSLLFVHACNHLPQTPLNYSRWSSSSPSPCPPRLPFIPITPALPSPLLVHWRNVDQNAGVIFVSGPRGGVLTGEGVVARGGVA